MSQPPDADGQPPAERISLLGKLDKQGANLQLGHERRVLYVEAAEEIRDLQRQLFAAEAEKGIVMTDKELAEIEAQADSTVPYYVVRLIQAVRDERRRAVSAERALDAATKQIEAMSRGMSNCCEVGRSGTERAATVSTIVRRICATALPQTQPVI